MDGTWAVACVNGGQEFRFRDAIVGLQAGVGAYAPARRFMHRPRHPGRPWHEARRPAIQCYVLLWTEDVRELGAVIAATRLDGRVIRANGIALPVREREVLRLRAMEIGGALDTLPGDITLKFIEGSLHFVREGALAGELARVNKTPRPGAKRVEFIVKSRRITMPLAFFGEP